MGEASQDKVRLYLGDLIDLLDIQPRADVIKALTTFWDPARNVFHFPEFELTPTLEEIAGYIGKTEIPLRHGYLLAPRAITPHIVLDILKISRGVHDSNLAEGFITSEFIYTRYGCISGLEDPKGKLYCKVNLDKWEEHRWVAFIIMFLGKLVFPRKVGRIDARIAGIVNVLTTQAKSTLAPLILSDMYQALTLCKAGGGEGGVL